MQPPRRLRRLLPEDDKKLPGAFIKPSQFISLVEPLMPNRLWSAWFDPKRNQTYVRQDVTDGDRSMYYDYLVLTDGGRAAQPCITITVCTDVGRQTFFSLRQALQAVATKHSARLEFTGGRDYVTTETDQRFPQSLLKPSRIYEQMVKYLDPRLELEVTDKSRGPGDLDLLLAPNARHYGVGYIILPTAVTQCQLHITAPKKPRDGMIDLLRVLLHQAGDQRGLRLI